MSCETVDELAAAYALGGVELHEERELEAHLEACDQPHTEARELIGSAALLASAPVPVAPREQLRERLMATVAATPQEHRPAAETMAGPADRPEPVIGTPWWRRALSPMALAAVALAVVVGLGAWNLTLAQQLADRDRAIRAIAAADSVHQVTGSAGSGLLLDDAGTATFIGEGLAELPAGQLYELWLIGPDGVPVAVGTLADAEGIALVTLERPIGEATTFAITIEAERVEAPTTDPVLIASLEG